MKKLLLLLVVISILLAVWWRLDRTPQALSSADQHIAEVVVYHASTQPIRDEVEALGSVSANEAVVVTPIVSDLVTAIYFNDGDMVKAGQLLVQLNDAQQRAQLQQAQVQLAESRRELKRIQGLVDSHTIAASEQDRLQTLIDSALAQVAAANAAVNDRQIRAPFAGRLGMRQISLGSLVTPGMEITTLDDIATIKLDFPVPERFIQQLQPGKLVEASAVAYEHKVFNGEVITIDSRVNPETRAITVRAKLPNPDAKLLPGMLMKVRLIKQDRQAILLPESAIVPVQQKHQVYVVKDENTASRREVTIGQRTHGWVEIIDGVTAGEQVIVRGLMKVREGQLLRVKSAESFNQ